MIAVDAPLYAVWLPVSSLVVEQVETRSLDRVRHYLNLLVQYPEQETGVIAVRKAGTHYAVEDGHHRYLAHVLAGRDRIACVIVG